MKNIEKLPLFKELTSNDSAQVCGGESLIVKATIDLTNGHVNMEYEKNNGNNSPYPYCSPYPYFGLGYYNSYYGSPLMGRYYF